MIGRSAFGLAFICIVSITGCRQIPPVPAPKTEGFLPPLRQQIEEARKKALAEPPSAAAAAELGRILLAYDVKDASAASFARAEAIEPGKPEWPYYLGLIAIAGKEPAQAAGHFRRAHNLEKGNKLTALRLAEALRESGKGAEAKPLFEKLIEEKAYAARAHFGLGKIMESEGRVDGALSHYLQACGTYQFYGQARFALANLYRKKGETANADEQMALFQQSRNREPSLADDRMAMVREVDMSPRGYVRRARQWSAKGKQGKAIQAYQNALRVEENHLPALVDLIGVYSRMGQSEKAEAAYKQALAAKADAWESHFNWGLHLERNEKFKEALEAFRKAESLNAEASVIHAHLGILLGKLNRGQEAAAEYRIALKNNADALLVNRGLGLLLARKGACQEAIPHLEIGRGGRDAESAQAAYQLGLCYRQQKEPEKARAALEDARTAAALFGPPDLAARIERDLGAGISAKSR